MSKFGTPAYEICSKFDLIDYLGTAWATLHLPIILMYLSRAEAVETPDELDALCDELGV